MRIETFIDGVCIEANCYDLDNRCYQREEHGVIVMERAMTDEEWQQYGPQPLDSIGALATLLAATGAVTVNDAANAVGLTAQDLINEAQAWAAAQNLSAD